MKTPQDIRSYRDELRETLSEEQSAVSKELLREQIFALDRTLGLFDNGEPLSQFELFSLLQRGQAVQATDVKDWENPRSHQEIQIVASVSAYRWVLAK